MKEDDFLLLLEDGNFCWLSEFVPNEMKAIAFCIGNYFIKIEPVYKRVSYDEARKVAGTKDILGINCSLLPSSAVDCLMMTDIKKLSSLGVKIPSECWVLRKFVALQPEREKVEVDGHSCMVFAKGDADVKYYPAGATAYAIVGVYSDMVSDVIVYKR